MAVTISIKSELDSRVILYPLMRCLKPLGNILIVTSNTQVSRLIDGDSDGDFRNFHILIDTEGATDELMELSHISPDEYTYVVYDNVGVVEQDKLLIPIGPVISESFNDEMMYLGEDKDTHIIRFGKPLKENKTKSKYSSHMTPEEREALKELKKAEREAKKAMKKGKHSSLSEDEAEEQLKLKFKVEKEDVAKKIKKLQNMKFPSFEEFELFESTKVFFNIDRNIVKYIYAVLKPWIGLTEPNYTKEVSRKDESRGSLGTEQASWKNYVSISSH